MIRRKARVAIVGAGVSGLCTAVTLQQAGINDFTIFERGEGVGGTWSDHTYPGLSCDVPSRFFQYSFDLNPDWSARYSTGEEIHSYLERVASRFDLYRRIRFGVAVTRAEFRDGAWLVTTSDGECGTFEFLVTACGFMSDPIYPQLPGLSAFAGPVIHSADWDRDVDTSTKRVGLVGTGASGVQLTIWLAANAEHLTVFQRNPPWVVPRFNRHHLRLTRMLHRRLPGWSRTAYRYQEARHALVLSRPLTHPGILRWMVKHVCRAYLHTVRSPALRAKLTPSYEPMCKRIILSSDFYRAVQRPNVTLETSSIDRIEPTGILTADGAHHPCDILVLATGYDTHTYMNHIDITGDGGVKLKDLWRGGPQTYHGVTIPCMPNFFSILGPFAPTGAYSAIAVAEMHARFATKWITCWQNGAVDTIAPTAEATSRFQRALTTAARRTVWSAGCRNPYVGSLGIPEVSPWSPWAHRQALRTPEPNDWQFTHGPPHHLDSG
ncbi:flavin-containing monooxygenase [Streptomyces lavendulae]|uniref:flavin-containing monooxygenase n=1 Tax=Streptomyces lavendulae TaxID=1914 RepID=UPI0024A38409|nr:NAD(P)/FAD-dependent oxidoreductase [Streptomyces lavendulae]GLW04522.1 putative monooxygenase [Streptomyces lavendulae subsp. lavendulae]